MSLSRMFKLIIPFLDESLTKEDISPEAGFVGAYNKDKNRPYIENCIFLMYDNSVLTKQAHLTKLKLDKLKTLYNKKTMLIDNKSYDLYAIKIIDIHNNTINNFLSGIRATNRNCFPVLVKFYGAEDGYMNAYFCGSPSEWSWSTCDNIVPEEDNHKINDTPFIFNPNT